MQQPPDVEMGRACRGNVDFGRDAVPTLRKITDCWSFSVSLGTRDELYDSLNQGHGSEARSMALGNGMAGKGAAHSQDALGFCCLYRNSTPSHV